MAPIQRTTASSSDGPAVRMRLYRAGAQCGEATIEKALQRRGPNAPPKVFPKLEFVWAGGHSLQRAPLPRIQIPDHQRFLSLTPAPPLF